MAQDGSLLDLLHALRPWRTELLLTFAALPVATWAIGSALKRGSPRSAAVFLSIPIHATVIPGVWMALTAGYLLFFVRGNLLTQVDAVLVFGPIACMAATLFAASRVMSFDRVPGFERLSGLVVLCALAFAVAYLVYRLAFRVLFFTPFTTLLLLFALAFFGIRAAGRRWLSPRARIF